MTSLLYVLLLSVQHGIVMFDGVPVPGAVVTATQENRQFVSITDAHGTYSFAEIREGQFSIQVEVPGFFPIKKDIQEPFAEFNLRMLPLEQMNAQAVLSPLSGASLLPKRELLQSGMASNQVSSEIPSQRTEINVVVPNTAEAAKDVAAQLNASNNSNLEDLNERAAEGFLINGSVNNAAASPFAQSARIGNAFRGKPLYTGNSGVTIDSSRLNARSYSLTGQATPEPSYNRLTASFNFGGPLWIPFLNRIHAPTFFVGYQRLQNRNAQTTTGRMPTAAERNGDFSHLVDNHGQQAKIVDPVTGLPFPGNIIPPERISPQAKALLNLFPLPNFQADEAYNYQIPLVSNTHQDSLQGRVNKTVNAKNQIGWSIELQSLRSDNSSLFNFLDSSRSSGINTLIQWTTRRTQRFSATFRYQFNSYSTHSIPYFAFRRNVSGLAGISGNNQEAPYWGPPTLNFGGGISTLSDGTYSYNRTLNHSFSYSSYWLRGRHNLTFGAEVRRYQGNLLSQQDARGEFTFTGAAAGSDFAGFLLGIPDTSSIAFGNADKYLRQTFYNGFVTDDFRVNGKLTINYGVRWEYETPVSELRGRLVNLNIEPDFKAITPVSGSDLVEPDRSGIQPRVSFAWRPMAASSLIVRGGFGIYRNTNVYQAIAMRMAQQSPFSKTLRIQNTPENPLTLANGFVSPPGETPNTFAVDPNFRVGYLQSWQISVQRDLPLMLQFTAAYLGTKGTRLQQEILPNTYPSKAVTPSGYIFLSSNGNSIRHAGQLQLRRRLHEGLTASAQYTFSKSLDDSPLMAGGQDSAAIAQDWLDLHSERALSSFDQRHQLNLNVQYTMGFGIRGGALMKGWRGALFKEWTSAFQLVLGSGLPLTPIYFAAVQGTGVAGNLRPDITGASVRDAPPGLHVNPAAYRIPIQGQWGNAGRNSITGPSQFSFDSSLSRSFLWHDRYSIDLRVDATNVLNHVNVKRWNTTVTSTQFGLPNQVNPMRTIQTTFRFRF